ncbi:hypothetical protein THAOC_26984, partial [Thalassiosira oceanica]
PVSAASEHSLQSALDHHEVEAEETAGHDDAAAEVAAVCRALGHEPEEDGRVDRQARHLELSRLGDRLRQMAREECGEATENLNSKLASSEKRRYECKTRRARIDLRQQ